MWCEESQLGTVIELTAVCLKRVSSNFHNHHPTRAFHILSLERFDSVGKRFYVESAQEVKNKSKHLMSSFFILLHSAWVKSGVHVWFPRAGLEKQINTISMPGPIQKEKNKNKWKKVRKCYTLNTAGHSYTFTSQEMEELNILGGN